MFEKLWMNGFDNAVLQTAGVKIMLPFGGVCHGMDSDVNKYLDGYDAGRKALSMVIEVQNV